MYLGRQLPGLLRGAGVEVMDFRVLVPTYTRGADNHALLVGFASIGGPDLIGDGLVGADELAGLVNDLDAHTAHPETMTTYSLFCQAWARRPITSKTRAADRSSPADAPHLPILTGTPQAFAYEPSAIRNAKSRSSKSPTGSNASMWWCDQSLWSLSFTASIAPSALSLRSSTMSFALPDAPVGLAFVLEVVVVGEVAGSFLGAALEVVGGAIHGVSPDVGRVSEFVSTVPCVGRFEPARHDFTLWGKACSLAQGFVHGHGVSRRAFQRSRSTARRAMPRSSAARTACRVAVTASFR